MVFQDPTLLPWRSALDNLRIVHPDLGEADAQAMLDKVGLGDRGGLSRAVVAGPAAPPEPGAGLCRAARTLIMDEPFVSLDAATADEMLGLTEP